MKGAGQSLGCIKLDRKQHHFGHLHIAIAAFEELANGIGTLHSKAPRQLRLEMAHSQQNTVDFLDRLILKLSDHSQIKCHGISLKYLKSILAIKCKATGLTERWLASPCGVRVQRRSEEGHRTLVQRTCHEP